MDQMNNDTQKAGGKWMEAFDLVADTSTRMSIYADKATEDGFNAIGDTLNDIARSDKAIARVMLERADEIGPVEENIQWSLENSQQMREYFDELRGDGDDPTLAAISQVFEVQINTLQDTLDSLDAETIYMPGKESDWVCSRCGFIATGRNCPLHCPLCSCHQGFFRPIFPFRRPTPLQRRPSTRPPYHGRR